MTKPAGRRNNATIVREYLHKKFADLTETKDVDEIILSIVSQAKEGGIAAQRLFMDHMDKIIQWEQKQQEGLGGVEIIIARDGVEVKPKTVEEVRFKPELFYEWNGIQMSLPDICRTENLPYKRVWDGINQGESIEEAVQFVKDTEVRDG